MYDESILGKLLIQESKNFNNINIKTNKVTRNATVTLTNEYGSFKNRKATTEIYEAFKDAKNDYVTTAKPTTVQTWLEFINRSQLVTNIPSFEFLVEHGVMLTSAIAFRHKELRLTVCYHTIISLNDLKFFNFLYDVRETDDGKFSVRGVIMSESLPRDVKLECRI